MASFRSSLVVLVMERLAAPGLFVVLLLHPCSHQLDPSVCLSPPRLPPRTLRCVFTYPDLEVQGIVEGKTSWAQQWLWVLSDTYINVDIYWVHIFTWTFIEYIHLHVYTHIYVYRVMQHLLVYFLYIIICRISSHKQHSPASWKQILLICKKKRPNIT